VEYWIGLCYGQLHNPDRQIESFKRSLKNDPDFEAAKVALAEAEGKVGRIALNPKEILKILRNTDSTMTVLKLFPLAIAANRQIPKEERNWESLEQLLRDLEEKFPDSAEISLLRYELMVAQERPDEELEKHLYALAEKYPKAFLSRRQLVGFLVGKKKYDEAEKQLAAFEETNGDTVDLRLAKASCYVQRYGKEAKDRLKSLEADTDAFDAREKNFLLTNLLNLMQAIDAQDEVQRLTEQLSGQGAGGLQVPSVRFEQAFKTSNVQEMEDAVRDLEKAENRGPISQYAKARLLLFKNSQNKDAALVDEALALLEKAKESRPNWPAVSFLMGFIYDQKGKPQQALEFYGETINQGNYNPTAIARTLMILAAQKRLPEALDLMNRLDREQAPITPAILKAWAEILWRQGEIDKALEKVRKFAAAAADSEDYRDFIFVGAVVDAAAQQAKANDPKKYDELLPEAEKAFRRAVELGKDAPEPWIALIQFLTTAEKVSEAEPVVEEAKKKISSKDAHLAFARIYEVLKKNDLAKEEYQAALAADSASSRVTRVVAEYAIRTNDVKQAEDLLTRIIDGKEVKSEKTDVMWARRTMALIIVRTRPGYENVEKARKLVERNLADDPKSTEDQSLWASFNSRDPKASNRLQAIQKLQELVDRKQASEKDMFTLSTLYLDNKDWRAASNVLRKLVVNSKDPQYMVFYILQLLEHNEEPDANLYLAQLRGKWPNHFQTVALEAELILRRGKPEEALDLVKGFVDRADAVPANRDQRIVLMMQVLEGLVIRVQKEEESDASKRFLETAERYLSSYVDGHPSAAMEFVKFLARRDRFEDAVAYLESNWTKCDEIAVAEASLAAADQGRGPKEVVDRTLNVLKDALQKFDNHPSLLLAIGDIHVGETKYDEAENCYREVLKNNPKLSTAMNNLVVMITLKPKNEKELNEALKMIDDAIRISGPVAQMLDTRACVYIALGQSDKALADMNDVVADRKTPDRLFHQAQALELAGKKNEAAIVMEEALGMGLSAKHLQKPELPAFERLKKLAKVESGGKKGK
jgi:tetratricopeptide (TPR) repeat protein